MTICAPSNSSPNKSVSTCWSAVSQRPSWSMSPFPLLHAAETETFAQVCVFDTDRYRIVEHVHMRSTKYTHARTHLHTRAHTYVHVYLLCLSGWRCVPVLHMLLGYFNDVSKSDTETDTVTDIDSERTQKKPQTQTRQGPRLKLLVL